MCAAYVCVCVRECDSVCTYKCEQEPTAMKIDTQNSNVEREPFCPRICMYIYVCMCVCVCMYVCNDISLHIIPVCSCMQCWSS